MFTRYFEVINLSDIFSGHIGTQRKIAFTLAEVLITIGIIGVVAAMTLPALLQKYQEQVTVTKVKKFYSVANQALLMAIKDNGYVDEWDINEKDPETNETLSNRLASKLKPYLKITKDCGENSGCLKYEKPITLLSGAQHINYDTGRTYYKIILADGSYIWIRRPYNDLNPCTSGDVGLPNVCGVIWIDINGKNQPNTVGKDIFTFYIQKNRIISTPENDCNSTNNGWGCSNYILQHGNMNYLHK